MLILLPPSEGKHQPSRGKPIDLEGLHEPELGQPRRTVIDALVALCRGPADTAREVLGLPPSMAALVAANADAWHRPTAPASQIYTGVLYTALDLPSLHGTLRRRANSRLAVVSALFGLVRPTDRIFAYRLSGGVVLPEVGPLTKFWREPLARAVPAAAGTGLIVDMRSSPYSAMWSPGREPQHGYLSVKVWQRAAGGQRTAVSHHNKAAKGGLARLLATAQRTARTAHDVAAATAAAGWDVELATSGRFPRLDVHLPA